MSKITSSIWPIEPHTSAKHQILRKYLDAWLPIITRWNGRALYIDGFAGPGQYQGGEDGSPVIAVKSFLEHKAVIKSEILMLFIEANSERCEFLETKIKSFHLPDNLKTKCICGEFEQTLSGLLNYIDEQKKVLAPAFIFIDPFGFTGIPIDLIRRIMENPRCEVLITFMYEEINRFVSLEPLWGNLNKTFGTEKWKDILHVADAQQRINILHNIYEKQLESSCGIKHVRSFRMLNRSNKTDYFLFFGTNNITGLKKMKEAMWRLDKSGQFQFSDATHNPNQLVLFEPGPNFSELEKNILAQFNKKTVSVIELENFIVTQTPFRETHYKQQILKAMENSEPPEINVSCHGKKRRKGTYPPGCMIEFL
jgi:three-Cys-motif partner protein